MLDDPTPPADPAPRKICAAVLVIDPRGEWAIARVEDEDIEAMADSAGVGEDLRQYVRLDIDVGHARPPVYRVRVPDAAPGEVAVACELLPEAAP